MALERHRRAVGVFPNRRDAELALTELRDANFPMDKVSVIAQDKDHPDHIAGANVRDRADNKADEGAKTGAIAGGTLGGLTGLLVGLGSLALPGIGPIMLAGATATAIATTLAGGAIGAAAGSLLGALIGLGIPEERAKVYNERVSRGEYLVIVEGTEEYIRRAETILRNRGIQEWGIYDAPDVEPGRTHATTHTTARHDGEYHKSAIGVFRNHQDAEAALRDLRDAGFPMSQISLVGKDIHGNGHSTTGDVTNRTKTDEGAKAGATTGGILGGLGGLLVGLGALALPGIGPVIAGGALATALATTAAGTAIGAAAGGLVGALVGLGIPENRARYYNDRVAHGDYLLMINGTDDEIRHAQTILNRRGIQDFEIYDSSDVNARGRNHSVIEHETTPRVNAVHSDANVISSEPEVIIIDRREQVL
ncbi:MAG TPA: histidine kinase [Cyanobacteria bacterium UBA11162]|nr:histidine kinase [Cyanobacteria bacterium UBA11162]